MKPLEKLSFALLATFLISAMVYHAFSVETPQEPKYSYKYVSLKGSCNHGGYLGNKCFKITREVK